MSNLSERQAASGVQGRAWENAVETMLQVKGWSILCRQWRHPECMVEVDIVANDPDGNCWWIECKGSWEGSRPGMLRTDTTKKALLNGAMLAAVSSTSMRSMPYMIITSHLPTAGSAGARWVELALAAGYVHVVATLDQIADRP